MSCTGVANLCGLPGQFRTFVPRVCLQALSKRAATLFTRITGNTYPTVVLSEGVPLACGASLRETAPQQFVTRSDAPQANARESSTFIHPFVLGLTAQTKVQATQIDTYISDERACPAHTDKGFVYPGALVPLLVLPLEACQEEAEEAAREAFGDNALHRRERRQEPTVPMPGCTRAALQIND